MKNKLLILLPVLCLFLSSCFETEEVYSLNEDGTYTISTTFNMSGFVSFISGMMPDSVKQTAEFKKGTDTTINLGMIPDSLSKKMDQHELDVLKKTDARMQMNMSYGILKANIKNTGGSLEDLSYFLANFGNIMDKSKAANRMIKSSKLNNGAAMPDNGESPFKNSEFEYVITPTSFERKVKADVMAKQKEKDQKTYDMLKTMNMKMTSSIVINLPRPATSVENNKASLSADKKQFKLEIDMFEALSDPTLLNFKVNY